jgi:glycosyltransferase involved in cell wall biosynthesis
MADPKVLIVIGDYDGCAMWRAIQPVETLNKRGYPCAWRPMHADDIHRQVNAADIVVLERVYWMPGAEEEREHWFHSVRRINKSRLVVYETDDDVITSDSDAHVRLFHNDWTDDDVVRHRQATVDAMEKCDAITTTSDVLANIIRDTVNKPVYVLPNAINWSAWREKWASKKCTINKLVIGWTGGLRVKDDIAPMVEAWKVIAEKYADVHFVLAGTVLPEYRDILPESRFTIREWVPVHDYPMQYADFDIACCPLANLPFNYKKSPCKTFEAGAAECAVVASPVVYGDYIDHKKNGLIAETTDDWVDALSRLVEDQKYRKQLARRWGAQVYKRHNMETNCWQWARAWREIMASHTPSTPSRVLATV